MPDPTPTPTPEPTPVPPPAPWHQGVDAEMIGHWQNKGWKLEDSKEIAIAATKQARELERHFGVPADQLLKMPKADAKPEDIAAFRQRLGMPKDAKDYDFSTIKGVAGEAMAPTLMENLRAAAHNGGLSKDAATAIAAAVQKSLDDAKLADAAVTANKIAEAKDRLAKNWGTEKDFNLLKAMEGARRLGKPFVEALERAGVDYDAIMDGCRRIGVSTSEDTFVERGAGSGGNPVTREGATARLAEKMNDAAWGKRLTSGDVEAVREWRSLTQMIEGTE